MQDDKQIDKAEIIHEHFAALGRKGGANRAKALTAKRRSEIAKMGIKARWENFDKRKKNK